jgi:hypothetical protein
MLKEWKVVALNYAIVISVDALMREKLAIIKTSLSYNQQL